MTKYIIRPSFTIEQNGIIYIGGDEVDLDSEEFEQHKHKLEGVAATVLPLDFGTGKCLSYPPPYIDNWLNKEILQDKIANFVIEGSFFTPDIQILTEAGIIETQFINSHQVSVSLAAEASPGDYDLVFDNGSETTINSAISIVNKFFEIVDLRLGGTSFSDAAIEMREGMSFTRTTEGMQFSGEKPWKSWARFVGDGDRWIWNRSEKRSLSWIFKNSDFFMVGIGSRQNDPGSNAQYYQGEILAFFYSTRVSSLYGNLGDLGNGATQNFSRINKNNNDLIKITFTQNGENGALFSVYRLADASIDGWLDTSDLLGSLTIDGFGADEPLIMPFVIPQDDETTKLLGFILEQENV